MSPRRAAWPARRRDALALGVAVLGAPESVISRWLGEQQRPSSAAVQRPRPRSLASARHGARRARLAARSTTRVIGPRVQVAACAVADAVDALATVAVERDSLPRVGAIGTVAVAGGAAVAGLYLARELGRGLIALRRRDRVCA